MGGVIGIVVALGPEGKAGSATDPSTHPVVHRMGTKLKTPEGRAHDARRKWLSEAPNGWIKEVLGFRRLSFQGLNKVRSE